jgi:uncharacterized membrane protein YdbT with pleckstrin-like domain
VRTFGPAPGYLRLQIAKWALGQVSALVFIVLALFGIDFLNLGVLEEFAPDHWIRGIQLATLVVFFLEAAFSWTMLHLDYRTRWYILTDRSLRIREGIFQVREMTISLTNIQNISLRQGPLQRLVGIADVEVRTAGGGSSDHPAKKETASMHIGRLRGIDDAEAVRDSIVARWNAVRKGEGAAPTSEAPQPAARPQDPAAALLAAGRALEAEARALGACGNS